MHDSWFEKTPAGCHTLLLRLDDYDRQSLVKAMKLRQTFYVPQATHDDANTPGMLIAEICRGWIEFMDKNGGEK